MRCAFRKTLILLPIPHTYSYILQFTHFHISYYLVSFLCFLFNCDIILGIPIEFIGDFFNNVCFGIVIFDIKIFFANLPYSSDLNDFCLLDSGAQSKSLTGCHHLLHFRHGLHIYSVVILVCCGDEKRDNSMSGRNVER